MAKFRVSNFRRERDETEVGFGSLGTFTLETGPIRIIGCTLKQMREGGMKAFPPRTRRPGSAVFFKDDLFGLDVTDAAHAAYVAERKATTWEGNAND
jgi:hypothetical protein